MDAEINYKITQALERIAKTFRVLIWQESKTYGLSPIQIQILIFALTHKPELLKVSFLAKEFDLTKATISDSVKILLKKELLNKVPDTADSRSYSIELTTEGRTIAVKTSGYTMALEASIAKLADADKGVFLCNLLKLIADLNQNAVISIQRMCLTCYHYSKSGDKHYCAFLEKKLQHDELRVDCADHVEIKS